MNYLTLVLHNTGGGTGGAKEADCNTILNEKCGSEYVQKSKKVRKAMGERCPDERVSELHLF